MHLIVKVNELPIEIQMRSQLQHYWAQFSEMMADQHGQELKYGGGFGFVRDYLETASSDIAELEIKLQREGLSLSPPRARAEFEAVLANIEAK